MVATPWGDSSRLRDRQLRPVRGTPEREVRENQRGRLFAAMIACVSERGYAATTVEDLVELSGVSRRSFYDYFGDKAGCLRAAIEEIFGVALEQLQDESTDEDLEVASRRRFGLLATMATAQPAAAKVCLNDAFAAGPAAIEPMEDAVHAYEALFRRGYERSPEHAGMPEELISGRVGGILEVIRARLRSGNQSDLPGITEDIVAMVVADRPPPEPLKLSSRPGKARPESLDAADHSERAIRAFATLAAERGYPNVKVDDVLRLASMSATTFYAHFAGKEDLMMAAIDSACAQAVAAVVPAFNRQATWPDAVRAGFGALLGFLASRPALARLVTVEVYAAGDLAIERRASAAAPLGALIENNTTSWAGTPSVVFEILGGGVTHLLYETVRSSGAKALPSLAPVCTYLTLAPFLGPKDACRIANGGASRAGRSGDRRASPVASDEAIGFSEPMRIGPWLILSMLLNEPATVEELAAALREDEETVAGHVRHLEATGILKTVGEREGRPVLGTHTAAHPLNIISLRQASTMEVDERIATMRHIWEFIRAAIDKADAEGRLGRPDSFLTRVPMRLDDRGWRELIRLHDATLSASMEIAERSRERLDDRGEEGTPTSSIQVVFDAADGIPEGFPASQGKEGDAGAEA